MQTHASHDEKQREGESERQKSGELDIEAERQIAVGGQEVRRVNATGRCRGKKRDRKAGRRTEKFSLFIF